MFIKYIYNDYKFINYFEADGIEFEIGEKNIVYICHYYKGKSSYSGEIELSEINELTINGKLIIKDGEFTDKELKK